MMKTTNRLWTLALFIIALSMLCAISAESVAENRYISFNFQGVSPEYTISIIEDTLFYTGELVQGFHPPTEDYQITLLDSGGNTISSGKIYIGENNYLPYSDQIYRIRLERGTTLLSDRLVSFCNLNGVCEPCLETDCILIESSLTCADCPSGGSDYFCDLANDGACDPDCGGKDRDCPSCEGDCWYRDTTMPAISCAEDRNGVRCSPGQLCTGDYAYADDTGSLCCTGGKCIENTAVIIPRREENGSEGPSQPTIPEQPPEEINEGQGMWLIPFVAIALIALLAYLLLRKPSPAR